MKAHSNITLAAPASFSTCSLVGATIGFAFFIATSIILELLVMPFVEPPIYTYGQQAGMISLPLSTIIGCGAGIAFAGFSNGRRLTSVLALFSIALSGVFVAHYLWCSDGIGECNSAIILFYPIFGLCFVIAILGVGLSVRSFLRR